MGDLTKNLDLSELWPESEGACPQAQRTKAMLWAFTLGQPLRDMFGEMEVTRGYSNPTHNKEVGGSPTSDHLWDGEKVCADFIFKDSTPTNDLRLRAIPYLMSNMPHGFGQCIIYRHKPHLHLSMPTVKHKGEILVAFPGDKYTGVAWSRNTIGGAMATMTRLMAMPINGK